MSLDEEREAINSQLEYLASALARIEVLTEEEIAYLRNRKIADERASWAWKQVKAHAPWIAAIGTAVGGLIYWVITHTVTIHGPK